MIYSPLTSTRSTQPVSTGLPKVSFEFFPPDTPAKSDALYECIERLEPLGPEFVSVTYGAGGSTRERTHKVIEHILRRTHLTPAAHLTCVDASRDDVDAVVRGYRDLGVRHIVALRGDPPGGVGGRYRPHPEGYENAADLVAGISRIGGFEISVSAYPEKHPESPDVHTDFDMLKRKVDNGATRAITQFFFSNDSYFRYLDAVRARGIDIPIVPGIVPIVNFKRVSSFASNCGADIPVELARRFEGLEDDPEVHGMVAAAVAAEQVQALQAGGIDEFHFYTLNRHSLVESICRLLGLGREPQRQDAFDPTAMERIGQTAGPLLAVPG